ncbi:hypothetical protein PPL_01287 [Heterostelium album PN500]|uniref:tRNA-dihydrouridine synthase n=1 Tax=Heterostelium pallidum (strain ATCC 26659 / Pp 5 / PN500) TaxID=670386 RepID=D3AYM4_HETP5|nr:hypothetical protein PPL_01287 [Heterostelium album PN500]EFA86051.1 hypothetical protein PPL_01287 [Heterostelium album PN500]|eukprot:XP_020438157.1 hypothetical protein PPL_01287 [Heterostelium album PN500]
MIGIKPKWLLNSRMAISPMVDVTDHPFRQLVSLYSKSKDQSSSKSSFITWTEFVSVDGLLANPNRFKSLLDYSEIQRPIVCQLFGSDPDKFNRATKIVADLGFDGVDINMGCPVRKVVERQSSGSALIVDKPTAVSIINATKQAVAGTDMSVSVKTRIGFDEIEIEQWIPTLLQTNPDLLTLHLRTKKELSNCPAHWENEVMGRVTELLKQHRDEHQQQKSNNNNNNKTTTTRLFGNGDIESRLQIDEMFRRYSLLDGIMVGRGIYGKPWFFSDENQHDDGIDLKCRLVALVEHALLIEQHKEKYDLQHNLSSLNLHLKSYTQPLCHLGEIIIR